jgi:hypothetical protein
VGLMAEGSASPARSEIVTDGTSEDSVCLGYGGEPVPRYLAFIIHLFTFDDLRRPSSRNYQDDNISVS